MDLDSFNSNKEANDLLRKIYKEKNYLIIQNNNNSRICYVFFSSNGLYSTRTSLEAINEMWINERFEWKTVSSNKKIMKNAGKMIFVRDIYKAFYVNGINENINSIDKLLEFIKAETKGFDCILVGSSAGSYMAFLFAGYMSNVKRVIGAGGIVELSTLEDFTTVYKNVVKLTKYPVVNKANRFAYYINFYGAYNKYDLPNDIALKNIVNEDRLLDIGYNSDKHGARPDYYNLVKILFCKDEHIKYLITKKNLINSNDLLTSFNLNFFEKFKRFTGNIVKRIKERLK